MSVALGGSFHVRSPGGMWEGQMPRIHVNDIDIYYERYGDPADPPLLMIAGLTDYTAKCEWQVERLGEDFDMIIFDNRGAGRSTQPLPGYTMVDLADDAAGLLDALGIDSANVFGFSMGGMIALNLALQHPERVRRLALGCTTAGGELTVQPEAAVLSSMLEPAPGGSRYDDYIDGAWITLSPSTLAERPDLVTELAHLAAGNTQTPQGYMGQLQAVVSHDVSDQLGQIAVPTLVMHGERDVLVPPENGRRLADRIPGATYVGYPDAGHMFFIEEQDDVNHRLQAFFSSST